MSPDEMTTLAVEIGRLGQKMEDQDHKLDAIHRSLKDDLHRVEEQTSTTNGHVADVDRRLSRLQGFVAALGSVVVIGTPVVIFLAPHIH